jgi:hypothetical protein
VFRHVSCVRTQGSPRLLTTRPKTPTCHAERSEASMLSLNILTDVRCGDAVPMREWSSFRRYATGCEGRVEIESERTAKSGNARRGGYAKQRNCSTQATGGREWGTRYRFLTNRPLTLYALSVSPSSGYSAKSSSTRLISSYFPGDASPARPPGDTSCEPPPDPLAGWASASSCPPWSRPRFATPPGCGTTCGSTG